MRATLPARRYVGASLMPPSQYDNLMARLEQMSLQIQALDKGLRDHASFEAEEREHLEHTLRHALYGGNGDGPGIFERFRNIFDWRQEHISSHEHAGQERRAVTQDWRRFWLDTAKQTIAVIIAVVAIVIVFEITGKVITLP